MPPPSSDDRVQLGEEVQLGDAEDTREVLHRLTGDGGAQQVVAAGLQLTERLAEFPCASTRYSMWCWQYFSNASPKMGAKAGTKAGPRA